MNTERIHPRASAGVSIAAAAGLLASIALSGRYAAQCMGPREDLRADYVRLRDFVADCERRIVGGDTTVDLVSYRRAVADLAAIPLVEQWRDHIDNLVTTEGKNALLTHAFKASALTQTLVLGLVESTGFTAFNATNTAANITAIGGGSPTNGWNEAQTSQCAARGTPSFGTASAGSLATSAAVAFSMLATATMKGAFLMIKSTAGVAPTTTTGNTSGALYSCGAFSGGDRAVINGDTVNVTYTASA